MWWDLRTAAPHASHITLCYSSVLVPRAQGLLTNSTSYLPHQCLRPYIKMTLEAKQQGWHSVCTWPWCNEGTNNSCTRSVTKTSATHARKSHPSSVDVPCLQTTKDAPAACISMHQPVDTGFLQTRWVTNDKSTQPLVRVAGRFEFQRCMILEPSPQKLAVFESCETSVTALPSANRAPFSQLARRGGAGRLQCCAACIDWREGRGASSIGKQCDAAQRAAEEETSTLHTALRTLGLLR